MKKVYLALSFAALFFMLGFFWSYHRPQIKKWILFEVERQSSQHSPIRVWAEDAEISLVPLRLTLRNVRFIPTEPLLAQTFAPGDVETLSVELGLGSLLKGRIRFADIRLSHPQVKIILKNRPTTATTSELAFATLFDRLAKLPFDDFHIDKANLMVSFGPQKVALHSPLLNVVLFNRFRSIFVHISTPQLFVKELGAPDGLPIAFETRFLFEPDEFSITALKIKKAQSYIVAAGQIKGQLTERKFETADVKGRFSMSLPEVQGWIDVFRPGLKLPHFDGRAILDLTVRLTPQKLDPEVHFRLKTQDVKIDNYILGKVTSEGLVNRKQLDSESITIQTAAGLAELKKNHIDFGEKVQFRSIATVSHVEMKTLLEDLNVKNVPIHLSVQGEWPCAGELTPHFHMACDGRVHGKDLRVFRKSKTKNSGGTIAAVKDFSAVGDLRVDLNQVDYRANIQAGQSHGHSDGRIDYETGFKINYAAQDLDFKDVDNLVDLKISGKAQVKGSTEGNASRATFNMDVSGQNMWLEDFALGDFLAKMQYKEGTLSFKKIKGHIQNTRYNGRLDLDLINDQMTLTGETPYIEINDVAYILSRRKKSPVHLSGTGTSEFHMTGPLRLSALSYQLKSTFYRGDIADETFDELHFNISAVKGVVQTDRVTLSRGTSVMYLNGQISPSYQVNARLSGDRFHVEQFELVNRYGFNVTGLFNFKALFSGPVADPEISLHGEVQKLVANDQPLEDSGFDIKFINDRIHGDGHLFGETLTTHFVWPLQATAPFQLQAQARNWDFTQMLSMISEGSRQKDFETALTGQIDLQANRGGLTSSNGKIEIDNFLLRHGTTALQNPRPLRILFVDGLMRTEFFALKGENAFLQLETLSQLREQIDVRLNGQLDLNLFSIFTPFFTDLRGSLTVALTAKGAVESPVIHGSALLNKGFIRFKDFPHTFENIKSEMTLARRQIQINSLDANLGGGHLSAQGKINYVSLNTVPIDVSGRFDHVALNVPAGFSSQGSGTLQMTGDRFPYIISLQYDLTSGEITREFSSPQSLTKEVKPSAFLPATLDQQAFQPIRLDLRLNLKNPASIKNSLIDSQITGQIHLMGVPSQAKLNGRIDLQKGGKVFFRDTPFEVVVANAEYRDDPPENPMIYLQARARVTENSPDNRPQSYDIDLIVQGHPKDSRDLKITFSSSPALSQQQIISLLALGMTMSTNTGAQLRSTESQNSALATQGSVQLGTALLKKPIGNEIKDKLGVDMDISSAYSQIDQSTVPKVTFSKQWTPTFIGSASRTIDKSPVNLVKLEYKLNKGLSVIGSWQGQSTDASTLPVMQQPQVDPTPSIFGLDLEYKIEFK